MEAPKIENVGELFTDALTSILRETCDLDVNCGAVSRVKHPTIDLELTVLVGLLGHLEGQVSYSMTRGFACRLAEQMLGEEVDAYGDMAESAVCELGNMVTGRAAVELQGRGFDADLCPPSIILASRIELSSSAKVDTLVVPIHSDWGELEMHLSVTFAEGKARAHRAQPKPAPTITGVLAAEGFLADIASFLAADQIDKALERARMIKELNFACASKAGPVLALEGADCLKKGKFLDARRLLEASCEFAPDSFDALLSLGHCRMAQEELDGALETFAQAASAEPDHPDGYYWAGKCYEAMGRSDKARRAYLVAKAKGRKRVEEDLARLDAS